MFGTINKVNRYSFIADVRDSEGETFFNEEEILVLRNKGILSIYKLFNDEGKFKDALNVMRSVTKGENSRRNRLVEIWEALDQKPNEATITKSDSKPALAPKYKNTRLWMGEEELISILDNRIAVGKGARLRESSSQDPDRSYDGYISFDL